MRDNRFKLAGLLLVLATLAGCAAVPGLKVDEDELSLRRGETRLINEGGPVFAMPGEVVLPAYYEGTTDDVTITAEGIGGSNLRSVNSVSLGPDATFQLRVPQNAEIFFATTVITHQDALHRIRALVRPQADARITIDTVSTLVAAKIMLARESNRMAQLAGLYDQTADLTTYARETLPADGLAQVRLDETNRELSNRFDGLVAGHPDLDYKLHAWEEALHAVTPGAAAGAETPPPATTPVAGPQPK